MSVSLTPSRKPSSGQRRRSAGTSGSSARCSHSDTSSSYQLKVKATEGSLTPRMYPSTPRRQAKHLVCSDNHGIRPPTPEQYLTPLQQKEVCIRHLRARLRENVERLQHRNCEIDDLRTQLYKMQEDWIEEECHRVEAQLALKEARKEIQHLQGVVESVRTNLSVREDPPNQKPYLRSQDARPGGRSRSCGCSPASTLTRSVPRTRLSSEALHLERSPNAPESSRASRVAGQAHLLLEAALLSEQTPPQGDRGMVPPSSTYERVCGGGTVLPMSHSCHSLSGSCRCGGHAYFPHHHLYLHLPQEEPPETVPVAPAADPVPTPTAPMQRKPELRSRACSPTMTWLCEESVKEELSVISTTVELTPSEPLLFPTSLSPHPHSEEPNKFVCIKMPEEPHVCQPHPAAPLLLPVRQEATLLDIEEDAKEENEEGNDLHQRCYWSPYFLVDLLALAVPVVPTMAWLCRGAQQDIMPVYHFGSLLRGCCAVALHSLRRQGAGRRRASLNGTIT
ncbi:syntaphilin isoform X1 [Nerophis lumbriciformis]|uniref:syntaphilin isoform X1 n=1 Tax=Nerophis lumbriciformis TaxID=546530 RepID=UPI002ADF8B67|nr:syntaphilin isoform X1 [Nerophis lumbriciformis]